MKEESEILYVRYERSEVRNVRVVSLFSGADPSKRDLHLGQICTKNCHLQPSRSLLQVELEQL